MSGTILLDVSRLVWRRWRGRLPTGIDRVCLAYLDRFAPRAQAVVQWRGRRRILPRALSARLFALLAQGGSAFRTRFAAMLPVIALAGGRAAPGSLYLNVGHTGLDDPGLGAWLTAQRLKPVFLIHDLIPITHPQFCRAGEGERHASRMTHALASASGIIANSQATLGDLCAFAASGGHAMPPALVAWIGGCPMPAAVQPLRLERPHFITVGTIEGRKNHVLLLRVWKDLVRRLGKAAPLLVIAGQRGWQADEALAMLDGDAALRGHVRELPACDDGELSGLIAGAQALLMPSHAEGFGLPVAEALHLRTPVIASDLPVYHEIAGDLPTFLAPQDSTAWEREIISCLGGNTASAKRFARYRAPDWHGHFARVEPWLAALLQKEGGALPPLSLD